MPELTATLEAMHKKDYEDKKFMAALKGIDIDKENRSANDVFERALIKARTQGTTDNANDIVSLKVNDSTLSLGQDDAFMEYESI